MDDLTPLISKLVKEKLATDLLDIGMQSILDDTTLFNYLAGELTQQAIAASPALYNAAVQSITLPISEAALSEARTMAARQAATLVTGEARTQLKGIGDVIAEGLNRGDGPRSIADRLKFIDSLDGPRAKRLDKFVADLQKLGVKPSEIERRAAAYKKKLLAERRDTIARTETANAIEHANEVQAKAAGKQFKKWVTRPDERMCPICSGNELKGWISINDNFPSGQSAPPAHPNCRCAATYRKSAPDDMALERQAKREELIKTAQGKL